MKARLLFYLLFFLVLSSSRAQHFFSDTVKGTIKNPFIDWIKINKRPVLVADSFLISEQVTLADYKIYLASVKKDSSQKFYLKQLPDSSVMEKSDYSAYLNSGKYDKWPVAGISWYAAMNYCIWKTKKEYPDSVLYYYCLPNAAQWVFAKKIIETKKKKFSANLFSDWVLDAMDESAYDLESELSTIEYFYYGDTLKDSKVLLRKTNLGNNWKFSLAKLSDFHRFYGYGTRGYSTVSFRIIKRKASDKSYFLLWGVPGKRIHQQKFNPNQKK